MISQTEMNCSQFTQHGIASNFRKDVDPTLQLMHTIESLSNLDHILIVNTQDETIKSLCQPIKLKIPCNFNAYYDKYKICRL